MMSRRSEATTSSWVMASTLSRPARSLKRTISGPIFVVAAALPPEVGRVDDRHLHLLGADRVHLLADDLLDPLVDAEAEGQERVDARAQLAHVARPEQQAMRRHLGVRRVVAQGREEQLREAHSAKDSGAGRLSRVRPAERRAGGSRAGVPDLSTVAACSKASP